MIAQSDLWLLKNLSNFQPQVSLKSGKSAETSGGLLIAIPKDQSEGFLKEFKELTGHEAWIIGHVSNGDRKALLVENLEIIEIESDEFGKLHSI